MEVLLVGRLLLGAQSPLPERKQTAIRIIKKQNRYLNVILKRKKENSWRH
jgi:hypothetical protein